MTTPNKEMPAADNSESGTGAKDPAGDESPKKERRNSKRTAAKPVQRTWAQRKFYDLFRVVARLSGVFLMGLRVEGREHIPAEGGALVCSNHQSLLDPVLVGLACDRRLNYMARKTLFRMPGFKQFIQFLDAIPIDRDGGGIEGIKETLKRLKRGEMVLIFPEGTRTRDGELRPLKPGFCALARRGKTPLLPVAIDGAYQAWPRSATLPRLSKIRIQIGPPIEPDLIAQLSDKELIAELQSRLESCFEKARVA